MSSPPTLLPEMVSRQLEAMILDGRLQPGERLPAERVLCDKLNVSRGVLREALKALRARGVIETRRGSGTYVAIFQEFHPSTPLQKLLQNHEGTLTSLLEVRRLLEGEAAYLAAQRATDEDLEILRQAFEAMEKNRPGKDFAHTHAQLDIAFHRAIYGAAHNPVLLLALNGIRDLMMSFVFNTADKLYVLPMPKKQLHIQHRRIYQAIEGHNPRAARRAAHSHIDLVAQSLAAVDASTRSRQ